MRIKLFLAIVCAVAGGAAHAASTVLDFSSAGGTIFDINGEGTGFTTRLAGTGAGLLANDANLDLIQGSGVLRMTSTDADINGQRNLPTLEFVGINLSSLGFTGSQDLYVRGDFINLPSGAGTNSFDQFGVYAGSGSAFLTRGMSVNYAFFGGGPEGVSDNINNGVSAGGNFVGTNPGATLAVEIRRTAGVWSVLINGNAKSPAQPTFLNANSDLTVGVFTYSTDPSQFTIDLTRFEAQVVIPEPSCLGLAGSVLACGAVRRRRRK